MKLSYKEFEPVISLDENIPYVLNLESPMLFRKFLIDFKSQLVIGEGKFIFSERDKILQLNKCVDLLIDPFNTNVNQRKVLQKLYLGLEKNANDAELCEATLAIKSAINKYILDVEYESEFILEHNVDFDLKGLFSAVDLRFVQDNEDFLTRLSRYMEISRKFLGLKAVVLVNVSSYLSEEEIKMLWDSAAYNKLAILMLEHNYTSKIADEKLTIIDNDLCIVYNNGA